LIEDYNYERCEKYHGIDRELCNWFFNETTLIWGDAKIKQAQAKYGNVSVGKIYRGAKIDTIDELKQYREVEKGGTLKFSTVKSCTPFESEAKSFAWYVKSYDTLTMLYALKTAIDRGSAGEYGGVVLTLQPTPKNVVVKSYTEGHEIKENSDWRTPPCGSAEAEVLVVGDVKVISAKIFEPLTKENWKETALKSLKCVDDLSNSFLNEWIRKHKISGKEIRDFVTPVIKKLVKTEDDVAAFLSLNDVFFNRDDYTEVEPIARFIENYFVVEGDTVGVVYNGKRLYNYSGEKHMAMVDKLMTPKFVENLLDRVKGLEFRLKTKNFAGVRLGKVYSSEVQDVLRMIASLYRSRKFKAIASKSPVIKKLIRSLDKVVGEVLSFNPKYLMDHGIVRGHVITEILRDLKEFLRIHPKESVVKKKIFNHLYRNLAPRGVVTPELDNAINVFKDSVQDIFSFVGD